MVESNNKILVYDTSKGLGRLINKNFKNEYEITLCLYYDELFNYDLKQFKVAFFIINENEDIINFIAVRNHVKIIFVSSNKQEINQILKLLNNIELIDMQIPKNKMIDKIRFHLSVIFLNENYSF